jgi:hypothetical protein
LRPPLYDFDGYMYRLYALLPGAFYNVNPHHLLWNAVQLLVVSFAGFFGYPSIVPFQIFGILTSTVTLLLFYHLMWSASGDKLIGGASVILVASSPSFWQLALQNSPYPLAFLAVVLYLLAWRTDDGQPPAGARLWAAGLAVAAGVFFHQAMILLVPPGMLALMIYGSPPPPHRVARGLVWGATIAALVLGVYVVYARQLGIADPREFSRWLTAYVDSVHPIQLLQLGVAKCFSRSVIGLTSSLLQSQRLELFLIARFSSTTILALYGTAGIVAVGAVAAACRTAALRQQIGTLFKHVSLFAISLLSVAFWWAFAFAWESATPHYWALSLFPALIAVGFVLRHRSPTARWIFVATALLVAGWNSYANHQVDRSESRNFPEPLLASIQDHLGDRDIFIVLGDDHWYGGMNYILLSRILKYRPRDPLVTILNESMVLQKRPQSWRRVLDERIKSTLNSGGRVFVAAHVFNHTEYEDLAVLQNPFAEQIDAPYLAIDPEILYQQVQQIFRDYALRKSDFRIGSDDYYSVKPK